MEIIKKIQKHRKQREVIQKELEDLYNKAVKRESKSFTQAEAKKNEALKEKENKLRIEIIEMEKEFRKRP